MFVLVPGDSGLLQVEIFGVEKVFYFSDACACLCLRCVCAALQKTRSAYKSRGRIQYSAVLQRSNFTIVGATPKTDEGLEAETERDKERGEEKERERTARGAKHTISSELGCCYGDGHPNAEAPFQLYQYENLSGPHDLNAVEKRKIQKHFHL